MTWKRLGLSFDFSLETNHRWVPSFSFQIVYVAWLDGWFGQAWTKGQLLFLSICAHQRAMLSVHAICVNFTTCVCVAVDFVSNNACLCICICIYVYMYICIYVYMYICICIYVYMYICVYIKISASNLKHQPSITRNNNRTHLLLFEKYNN
jgi:uncharacterized protein YneF (UPF0154 family)